MVSKKVISKLNEQVLHEANASQSYLAMAIWADTKSLDGIAAFFYEQSQEEREHMLKIIKFINDVNGKAIIPQLEAPIANFNSIKDALIQSLKNENHVTSSINELTSLALDEKDHASYNFLQWFVEEQLEEEQQFEFLIDRISMIGEEGLGIHAMDKLMGKLAVSSEVKDEDN
tara:strand:+ start:6896 stop:7414 length:519 start_codon:yes stop_codon:yes gene_type:complete